MEVLKQYIKSLKWKEKKGVKSLGIYSHNKQLVFVDTTGAIGAGGKKVDTIIQVDKYSRINSDISTKPFITLEQLLKFGSLIFAYNEPSRTVPILGWVAGCFIKAHLKRYESKYPHLFLIGESGGGKSSTLEFIILKMFSIKKVGASNHVTQFTLMSESNSSNIIPQVFDEFKPSEMPPKVKHIFFSHLRDTYDMHEGERGNANQTVRTYELLAPMLVSGEQCTGQTAIRARTIEILFSPKETEGNEEYSNAFNAIKKNPILGAFGRTLLDVALQTTTERRRLGLRKAHPLCRRGFPIA